MHLRNLILIFVGIPAVELILLFEIHGILGFFFNSLLDIRNRYYWSDSCKKTRHPESN